MTITSLIPRHTPAASVTTLSGGGWRLTIPSGKRGRYRLAQLDDYAPYSRNRFLWSPPLKFNLQARVSNADLPGSWGFGLWNDPFGFSLSYGANAGRLPALPNTAWFFHASADNYLTLRDDLPAHGFFAGTFRSPRISSLILTPTLLALPFFILRPISRVLRRTAAKMVQQDGVPVIVDVTEWHEYSIEWLYEAVGFFVDGKNILHTNLSPNNPLGLVLWIDNQYAAWTPEGRVRYGTLENQKMWLEVKNLKKR